MATTPDKVRSEAPELYTLADPEIQNAIGNATAELNADSWGSLFDRGVCTLAAHYLCEAHPELYLGERVPARPASPADAGALGSTVYGVRHWRLRRSIRYAGGGVVVGAGPGFDPTINYDPSL